MTQTIPLKKVPFLSDLPRHELDHLATSLKIGAPAG